MNIDLLILKQNFNLKTFFLIRLLFLRSLKFHIVVNYFFFIDIQLTIKGRKNAQYNWS